MDGAADHDHSNGRALSDALDSLERSVHGETVTVSEIMDSLGQHSLATLTLIPALIAASPASGIPGLTSAAALVVALMVVQMLAGRRSAWLPGFLARRRLPADRLCQAVRWLRRPVGFVERFLRPRLTFLVKRPGVLLPLLAMLAIALGMPFLELIPTTGSIAGAAIAFFAAGLMMRDGALILAGLAIVVALPVAVWHLAA